MNILMMFIMKMKYSSESIGENQITYCPLWKFSEMQNTWSTPCEVTVFSELFRGVLPS